MHAKQWGVTRVAVPLHTSTIEGRYKIECFTHKAMVMKRLIYMTCSIVTPTLMLLGCTSVRVNNETVETLDATRYMGQWYEIARMEHWFERDMQRCTATYTLEPDGKITVTNTGYREGKWKESTGKAKLTKKPGLLRVSFFGPFYSDYRVLMVSPDYTYALVGGQSDDYLWILSRTPWMGEKERVSVLKEARRRGYDTGQLIWVEQQKEHPNGVK